MGIIWISQYLVYPTKQVVLVLEIIGQIKQTVEDTNDNQRKLDAKISEVLDTVKHRR